MCSREGGKEAGREEGGVLERMVIGVMWRHTFTAHFCCLLPVAI